MNQLPQRCLVQYIAYHIFDDSASHLSEDRLDRHGVERAVEISAPEKVQDTLRKGGI